MANKGHEEEETGERDEIGERIIRMREDKKREEIIKGTNDFLK